MADVPEWRRQIGERIRELRCAQGLSREEFGARIGARTATVFRHESGQSEPKVRTLLAICEQFGCRLDWLVLGKRRDSKAA